jgi:hypothetical protein
MMRCSEFLCKQITGILNFANRNSDFLTFQRLEFQKKKTGISGIRNRIGILLPMGTQESEPKIGFSNQATVDIHPAVDLEMFTHSVQTCAKWCQVCTSIFVQPKNLDTPESGVQELPQRVPTFVGEVYPEISESKPCNCQRSREEAIARNQKHATKTYPASISVTKHNHTPITRGTRCTVHFPSGSCPTTSYNS